MFLFRLGEDAIQRKQEEEQERKQQEKDQEATWYHEGPDVLKDARFWIAGKVVLCSTQQRYSSTVNLCNKFAFDSFLFTEKHDKFIIFLFEESLLVSKYYTVCLIS